MCLPLPRSEPSSLSATVRVLAGRGGRGLSQTPTAFQRPSWPCPRTVALTLPLSAPPIYLVVSEKSQLQALYQCSVLTRRRCLAGGSAPARGPRGRRRAQACGSSGGGAGGDVRVAAARDAVGAGADCGAHEPDQPPRVEGRDLGGRRVADCAGSSCGGAEPACARGGPRGARRPLVQAGGGAAGPVPSGAFLLRSPSAHASGQ